MIRNTRELLEHLACGVVVVDAAGKVLNAIAEHVPWLIGGAGDLAPSTKTNFTFDGAGQLVGRRRGDPVAQFRAEPGDLRAEVDLHGDPPALFLEPAEQNLVLIIRI